MMTWSSQGPPDDPSRDAAGGVLPIYVCSGAKQVTLFYNAVAGDKASSLTDLGGRREFFEPDGSVGVRLPSGRRPTSQTRETTFVCASRELYEESRGLWGLAALASPPIKPIFPEGTSSQRPTAQPVRGLVAECTEVNDP